MPAPAAVAVGGLTGAPLVAAALLAGLALAFVSRALANLFRGNKPPIMEGIPFIGGLLKFTKARAGNRAKTAPATCTACVQVRAKNMAS